MDNHIHSVITRVKEHWYKKVLNATSIKILDKFTSSMKNLRSRNLTMEKFIEI